MQVAWRQAADKALGGTTPAWVFALGPVLIAYLPNVTRVELANHWLIKSWVVGTGRIRHLSREDTEHTASNIIAPLLGLPSLRVRGLLVRCVGLGSSCLWGFWALACFHGGGWLLDISSIGRHRFGGSGWRLEACFGG